MLHAVSLLGEKKKIKSCSRNRVVKNIRVNNNVSDNGHTIVLAHQSSKCKLVRKKSRPDSGAFAIASLSSEKYILLVMCYWNGRQEENSQICHSAHHLYIPTDCFRNIGWSSKCIDCRVFVWSTTKNFELFRRRESSHTCFNICLSLCSVITQSCCKTASWYPKIPTSSHPRLLSIFYFEPY